MVKKIKYAVMIICLLNTLFLVGCETVKGAVSGAGEGMKKDWEAAKKTDNWMQDNLW